jgi:TPR repeat protein
MKKNVLVFLAIMFSLGVAAQEDNYEIGKRYLDNNDYSNALTYFQRAANEGDYNGQYFLGCMYLYGEGVSKNYTEAAKWLQKSAEQGHKYAQMELGILYFHGEGVSKNNEKALEWTRKAADQGIIEALYELGCIYKELEDSDNANIWFKKAAELGEASAQYELGCSFYYSDDYSNALIWLQKSANQNNADAQMLLGSMFLNGSGVNQDYYQAYDWLSKSANQGNSEAQVGLGYLFLNGNGVNKDYIKAFEWFRQSADQGNSQAAQALGVMYYKGLGINRDYKLAFEWFIKGTKGIPVISNVSKYHLGLMYYNGEGVKQDYSMAAKWFLDAAQYWDAKSQYKIAEMHYKGIGVKQDYNAALEWMTKAAEKKNYPNAQLALGSWYYKGEGMKQDYDQSEYWLKKCIEQKPDVPYSYHYLSLIYLYRDQNYRQAEKYADMAWERASKLKGENQASIYAVKGKIALCEGNQKKAQDILHKCIELNPKFLNSDNTFAKEMAKLNSNGVDSDIIVNPSNNKMTFAIIIGNEKYRNESEVPFAGNDAKVFSEYVEKTLGVPHDQIKCIENAGYNNLRIAINWLTHAMTVCRGNGKAIVYYAGHGIPNESDLSAYLLPVDGIGNDPGSAYSLNELYEKLGSVEAQSITIFLDACFSGSKREDGMLASARGVALKAKQSTLKGNMVVFSAAQGDETAFPYKEKQHGMFTFFLLKKLQETKGEVTLGELSEYLTDEVGRQSFIKNNKVQTPTVSVASPLKDSWRQLKLK